jgi:hypothetical protein
LIGARPLPGPADPSAHSRGAQRKEQKIRNSRLGNETSSTFSLYFGAREGPKTPRPRARRYATPRKVKTSFGIPTTSLENVSGHVSIGVQGRALLNNTKP